MVSVMPSPLSAYGLANIQGEIVTSRGVLVSGVMLDQAVYAVGDTAMLSFTITNNSDTVQPGLVYRVDLVGNFDETSSTPTTRFTTGESVPIPFLLPGDSHDVELRSILPAYVASGDVGFQVSVFNPANELVSTAYARMLITGTVRPSVTYVAQVQVDGEPFALSDGPTVYKGEQVLFAISLKNTRGALSLTPHIDVFKGTSAAGEPHFSFMGEVIPVSASRSAEQRMFLPTFEYTPGVYTAQITYKDAEGTTYAGPFDARYVVAGARPTLHSALPTSIELYANDAFEVVVTYNDIPKNMQLDPSADPAFIVGTLEAEVSVVDANNTLIEKKRVVFLPGKTTTRVSFTAPHYMYGMRIVTQLFEDGKVIDMQDVYLPDQASLVAETIPTESLPWKTLGVGIGVLLVIIIGIAIFRKRTARVDL
jgi:hypothetical protein